MNMTIMTSVDGVGPMNRPPPALAAEESAQLVALLRTLDESDWSKSTDCPAWDVRAMAGHVLGMTETFGPLRRFAHDMRAAGRAAGDGPLIDGLTAVQVRDHAALTVTELVHRLAIAGPRQAKWRASQRTPRAGRRPAAPESQRLCPAGGRAGHLSASTARPVTPRHR